MHPSGSGSTPFRQQFDWESSLSENSFPSDWSVETNAGFLTNEAHKYTPQNPPLSTVTPFATFHDSSIQPGGLPNTPSTFSTRTFNDENPSGAIWPFAYNTQEVVDHMREDGHVLSQLNQAYYTASSQDPFHVEPPYTSSSWTIQDTPGFSSTAALSSSASTFSTPLPSASLHGDGAIPSDLSHYQMSQDRRQSDPGKAPGHFYVDSSGYDPRRASERRLSTSVVTNISGGSGSPYNYSGPPAEEFTSTSLETAALSLYQAKSVGEGYIMGSRSMPSSVWGSDHHDASSDYHSPSHDHDNHNVQSIDYDRSAPISLAESSSQTSGTAPHRQVVGTDASRWRARSRRTREARYICDFPNCFDTFTASHNLRSHQLAHLGIKNYVCPRCGARFTVKGTLNRHSRTCKAPSKSA